MDYPTSNQRGNELNSATVFETIDELGIRLSAAGYQFRRHGTTDLMTFCPLHETSGEHEFSLHVNPKDEAKPSGGLKFHCLGGCPQVEIFRLMTDFEALPICSAKLKDREHQGRRWVSELEIRAGSDSDYLAWVQQYTDFDDFDERVYLYRDLDGDVSWAKVIFKIGAKRVGVYQYRVLREAPLKLIRSKLTSTPPLYGTHLLRDHPMDGLVFAVEGERDVDTLAAAGLVAVSTCWSGEFADIRQPLIGRAVVVIPDNDEAGLRKARTFAQLVNQLPGTVVKRLEPLGEAKGYDASDWFAEAEAAGDAAPRVAERVAELLAMAAAAPSLDVPDDRMTEEQERQDAADAANRSAAEAAAEARRLRYEAGLDRARMDRDIRRALDAEERAETRQIDILSGDEIMQAPDLEWLVQTSDGVGILETTGIFELSGKRQQFKTATLLGLMLGMVNGKTDWLGWKIQPTSGHVVLCIGEGGSGIKHRIAAWLKNNPGADLRRFHVLKFHGIDLADRADITDIITMIRSRTGGAQVAMVLLDAFADAFGGDENGSSKGGVGPAVAGLKRIATEFGGVCGIAHHSGHDGSRGRGSSRLEDAMDTVLHIQDCVLEVRKVKEADKSAVAPFEIEPVQVGQSFVVTRGKEGLASAAAKHYRSEDNVKDKICQHVRANGAQTKTEIRKAVGGRVDTVDSLLEELVKDSRLNLIGDGRGARYESVTDDDADG